MYRSILILNLLLLLHFRVFSQSYSDCDTPSDPRYLKVLTEHRHQLARHVKPSDRNISLYPTTVYIIRQSDGSGGLDPAVCDSLLEIVNYTLEPAGIGLYLCQEIQFIDSDYFYDYSKLKENSLYNSYSEANTMNVFIPNTLTTPSGSPLCGYAYYPGWKDMVVVAAGCALDGSTLVHEVGHYFGLLHTHGLSNVNLTDEFADFSNCLAAGDDVCDTPADPKLDADVDSTNCNYSGTQTDEMGNPFTPDPSNIMSYAPKPCKFQFTPGQYDRMHYVATYLRDYLQCTDLSADFLVTEESGLCAEEMTVGLFGTGEGAQGWEWDVDSDGVIDYSGQQAEHTFYQPGNYTICVTAQGSQGSITKCEPYSVASLSVHTAPFEVNFEDDPVRIVNPDHEYGWAVSDISPNAPYNVLMIDNYHYSSIGAEDDFYVGPVDLTTVENPSLTYSRAYAQYSSSKADALMVSISTDCGMTFSELSYESGADLTSVDGYADYQWMPGSPEEWETEFLDLGAYTNDTVIIRFTNITDSGNNLYIDDLSVSGEVILDLQFIGFQAYAATRTQHILTWETVDEMDVLGYNVQMSVDGIHFSTIGAVVPEYAFHNFYEFTTTASHNHCFYRIEVEHTDGKVSYSPIRQVKSGQRVALIYPNPVQKEFVLELSGEFSESIIQVYSVNGTVVDDYSIVQTGEGLYRFDVGNFPEGLYSVVAGNFAGRFIKVD